MVETLIVRPNGTVKFNSDNYSLHGGAETLDQALSSDSNSQYAEYDGNVINLSPTNEVSFEEAQISPNAEVSRIRLSRIMASPPDGDIVSVQEVVYLDGDVVANDTQDLDTSGDPLLFVGNWLSQDQNGDPWTTAKVATFTFAFEFNNASGDPVAPSEVHGTKFYDVWFEVEYVDAPSIEYTAPEEGITATNTPTIEYDFNHPDALSQSKNEIRVFHEDDIPDVIPNNPDDISATPVYTNTQSTSTHEATTGSLTSDETYRVYVRAAITEGVDVWSDWVHSGRLTINPNPTYQPTFILTNLADLSVKIDIDASGSGTQPDFYEVQKQEGDEWVDIYVNENRFDATNPLYTYDGIEYLPFVSGETTTGYDYEPHINKDTIDTYRVRGVRDLTYTKTASTWVEETIPPQEYKNWMLRSVREPSKFIEPEIENDSLQIGKPHQAAKFRPLGRKSAVIVHDVPKGDEFEITFGFVGNENWAKLLHLLKNADTLWLFSSMDYAEYEGTVVKNSWIIEPYGEVNEEILYTDPYRRVTVTFVEVDAPSN